MHFGDYLTRFNGTFKSLAMSLLKSSLCHLKLVSVCFATIKQSDRYSTTHSDYAVAQ